MSEITFQVIFAIMVLNKWISAIISKILMSIYIHQSRMQPLHRS